MSRLQAEGGLKQDVILLSVYQVYRLCREAIGIPTTDWLDLDDVQAEGYTAATIAGGSVYDRSEGKTVGQVMLYIAETMYRAYAAHAGFEEIAPAFATLPVHLRLLWEAMARHLVNLLQFDAEDGEPVGSHEEKIVAWYVIKCDEIAEQIEEPHDDLCEAGNTQETTGASKCADASADRAGRAQMGAAASEGG